jgi:hypothetical protein
MSAGADGHWHDNLLMDLLRDEMRSGAWAGTQATI